jgi:hypothetical protein
MGGMKFIKENRIQSTGSTGRPNAPNLKWWETVPSGERKLICSLMRMLRGARRSQLRDVAVAAAKWERGIGCFIKVRLMNGTDANGKHRKSPTAANQNSKPISGGICITVEPVRKSG